MKTEQSISATLAAMTQQTARIAAMAQTSNDECIRMSARIEELEGALRDCITHPQAVCYTHDTKELMYRRLRQITETARSILAKGN